MVKVHIDSFCKIYGGKFCHKLKESYICNVLLSEDRLLIRKRPGILAITFGHTESMWCVSSWWKPTRFLGMDEGIILWKALLALMFWRLKNLANSFELSQTRQRKRPWSVHYMCMQVLYTGMFVMFVFWCMHCIYTLAWGFSRCSFRQFGHARAFKPWNER